MLAPTGVDEAQLHRVDIARRAELDALARQQAREHAGVGQPFIELAQPLCELRGCGLARLRRTAQLLEHADADLVRLGALAALGVGEDRGGPCLAGFEIGAAGDPAGQEARHAEHVRQTVGRCARCAVLDQLVPALAEPRAHFREGAGQHLADRLQVAPALQRGQPRGLLGAQQPHAGSAFMPGRSPGAPGRHRSTTNASSGPLSS